MKQKCMKGAQGTLAGIAGSYGQWFNHNSLRHYFGVMLFLTVFLGFSQTAWADYAHKSGYSGRPMVDNGYGIQMQGVHTERIIVYMPTNSTRALVVPEKALRYSRWYDYKTDQTVSNAATNGVIGFDYATNALLDSRKENNQYASLTNNRGVFRNGNNGKTGSDWDGSWDSRDTKDANFTLKSGATLTNGRYAEVACDLSHYSDHTLSGTNQVEPTLSVRLIYDIRPSSEMVNALSGCTGTTYLEEYTIIAPAGQALRFGPQYEYIGDNSNYYTTATSRTNSGTWQLNGAAIPSSKNMSVSNNRVLKVNGAAAGTTEIYTLVAGGKNIAKFTIKYVSNAGPSLTALVDDAVLARDYIALTGLDFDGDRNTPLEWDETNYGFFYPAYASNRGIGSGTHYGEYELMNVTPSVNHLIAGKRDVLYKKTGSTTGNFLYVDAGSTPGVVANLRFKDNNLCAGTKLYVSAWVNNVGKDTDPNLNFSVIGINGATEQVITTYTTGDLPSTTGHRGEWKHIFFEVEMPQISFTDYRLRVTNNAQNTSGNDFGIDEIVVYMERPSLQVYQADVACPNESGRLADGLAVIRLDPAGFDFTTTNRDVYYQYKNGTQVVQLKDYVGDNGATPNYYGVVTLLDNQVPTGYAVYNSIDDYLTARANETATSNHFVVRENGKLIYYVVHSSATEFTEGTTYDCVIGTSAAALSTQSDCGMVSSFTMEPQAKLVLNGVISDNVANTASICGNHLNTLAIKLYGSNGSFGTIYEGTCKYDWLNGSSADYSAAGLYPGYDYSVIESALLNLRAEFPLAATLASVQPQGVLSADQIALLTQLVNGGMLELFKEEIQRRFTQTTTRFTLFPIPETAQSPNGDITVCGRPFAITILAAASENSFRIGYVTEQGLPADLTMRRVRLYEDELFPVVGGTTQTLNLPIRDKSANVTTTLLNSGSKIYLLNSSTDQTATLPFDDGTVANNVFGYIGFTETDGQITMQLNQKVETMVFKPGHRYDFVVVIPAVVGEACAGGAYFSLIVMPQNVMWSPKVATTNSWHVDYNWVMIDESGAVVPSSNGFVPGARSNVFIAAKVNEPILMSTAAATNSRTAVTLNDESQRYVEWDMNFVANSCQNIHFGPKAYFGNQHYLNYEKAWVDVALNTNQWNLFAPPFEGMVTGDMHIPASGVYTNPLFGDVDAADNRTIYRFYTSLFNSSSYNHGGNSITNVSNSEWTVPFNALTQPIYTGHGYSVQPVDNNAGADEVVVRLPKTETEYFYYNIYGQRLDISETVTRTGTQRLVGTNNEIIEANFGLRVDADQQSMHLMANPFMGELDIVTFMQDPLHLCATGSYSILAGDRSVDYTNTVTGVSTSGSVQNIPPMTSFIVEIDTEDSNPYLHITPAMMATMTAANPSPAPMTRSAIADAPKSELLITANRNGVKSRCMIVEADAAEAGYNKHEDTRIKLLSVAMTPSAIYTHADNQALAINCVPQMNMIPLGMAIQDESETQTLSLTFNGIDHFIGEVRLFDAIANQSVALTEGMIISLPELTASDNRYYITYAPETTTGAIDNTTQDGLVTIYQPENGQLVVASYNEIREIKVYGVNGQLVMHRSDVNNYHESFSLTQGAYLIQVLTESGVTVEKCVVR